MSGMPKKWNRQQLENDAGESKAAFRKNRVEEPERLYLDLFEQNYGRVLHVLECTRDLTKLDENMAELLADGYYDVIRYLAAPPISEDDMYVVAELTSRSAPNKLALPDNVNGILSVIHRNLDVRRFGWISDSRSPTKHERKIALVSTVVLLSTQQAQTSRRTYAKKSQEGALRDYLVEELRYHEVATRRIDTLLDAPKSLEFCGETDVAGKKADVVIGLGDNRFMCVECKVSNSEVNSVKRLNHETVEKTTHWYHALGTNGVVCAGLLSGVFKVSNLVSAQDDGVSLFWSHNLGALGEFIQSTYPLSVELQ